MYTARNLAFLALVLAAGCGGGEEAAPPPKETPPPPPPTVPDAGAPKADPLAGLQKTAAEAYVWGYPLVFMDREMRTMTTNVRLPLGSFAHDQKLPGPKDGDVFPNRDALLSSAWVDLKTEPMVLKVPAMGSRFYLFQVVDMYGDVFANVGTKDTGSKAGSFLLTGPGFKGDVPKGMTQIKCPTDGVWLLGRTHVTGDKDVPKALALLKKFSITTVAGKKSDAMPPAPQGRPQDLKFAGPAFFDELGADMKEFPPPAAAADVVAKLAKAGIGPDLTPSKTLKQEEVAAIAQGLKDGEEQIEATLDKLVTKKNGWDVDTRFGKADNPPVVKAAFILRGMDWFQADEAFFPLTRVDDGDRTLSGAHEYVLHFDKGKTPPVEAFWSLAMYGKAANLVDNPANRYVISDTSPGFKKNKDGSEDIYIQADSPKGHEKNWLPAPKNQAFFLVLRMYQPKPDATSGAWAIPPVKRIK